MRFLRLSKSFILSLLLLILLVTFVHAAEDDTIDADQDDISFGADDDAGGEDDVAEEKEETKPKEKGAVINAETNVDYQTKKPEGLQFIEDFQGDWEKRWIHSENSKYNGRFKVGLGVNNEIGGDKGLIIPEKAKHYGISTLVPGLDDLSEDDFVVQYEVRLDEGMTCGGAYLKLPTIDLKDPAKFDDSVKYSVMFGPDKCGATDKIHFIFQSKNPKTGKFTEHHLKSPPSIPSTTDKSTHLYTLYVKKDNTYELLVDNKSKKKGSLKEDFVPPIQPPKEIDDKEDTKPEDWVDTKKIPDPEAKKPDDWDEDAPREIPDKDAKKPDNWDESTPKDIPDPEAKKPENWDDEEDGEWVPKMIPNPACKDGCGPWSPPMIKNPLYKGKWTAPLIDNPEYKGEWKPRKVANPDYYEVEKPSLLGISGVGLELWTMDQGVVFDNIVLGKNIEAAKEFADNTWKEKSLVAKAKKEAEKAKNAAKNAAKDGKSKIKDGIQKADEYLDMLNDLMLPLEEKLTDWGLGPALDKATDYGIERPLLLIFPITTSFVFVFLAAYLFGRKKPRSTVDAKAKKTDKPTKDDVDVKSKEDAKTRASDALITEDQSEGATTSLRKRKTKAATAE